MEKGLLLITVNYEIAFKLEVNENENNIQGMKIMEINANVALEKKKIIISQFKTSFVEKNSLKDKTYYNVLLTFKAP